MGRRQVLFIGLHLFSQQNKRQGHLLIARNKEEVLRVGEDVKQSSGKWGSEFSRETQ